MPGNDVPVQVEDLLRWRTKIEPYRRSARVKRGFHRLSGCLKPGQQEARFVRRHIGKTAIMGCGDEQHLAAVVGALVKSGEHDELVVDCKAYTRIDDSGSD